MIVLLLGGNAETQYDDIEKRRLGQLYATGAVVIAGMELHLINPGAIIVALQQRRIDPAIAVGCRTGDQFQVRSFNAVQLDLDRAARATVCSVQNVCCQTSH